MDAQGKPKPPNWEYRFEGAPVDGKRQQISKAGFRTKKEAEIEGNKALAEYNNAGLKFEPSEISVADYMDYWLKNYCKMNVADSTMVSYTNIIKNLVQKDASRRICIISTHDSIFTVGGILGKTDAPVAIKLANPNTIIMIGIIKLTAARASSPINRPTNNPSAIWYSAPNVIVIIEGIARRKNSFAGGSFSKISESIKTSKNKNRAKVLQMQ